MLKFIFFALFSIVGELALAQPFYRAPELPKAVQRITEWVRSDFKEKSVKNGVSVFDQKGRLVKYYQSDSPSYRHLYIYDDKGRLKTCRQGTESSEVLTEYTYKKNVMVRMERFRGKVLRTIHYYKKGRLVEKKNYVKGGELGDRFLLKDRCIYSYNRIDSLQGELMYFYPIPGKGKPQTRKVVYQYDAKTKLRSSDVYYDFDGQIRLKRRYRYDEKGRIAFIEQDHLRDNSSSQIEYKYKNGKIWQCIETFPYKRSVKVYVDGRLIRNRTYMGEDIFTIVDYQYEYF
ncbi:MAG: hypothetical protein AAF990_21285 [Bacteroidota bacterium]